MDIRTEYLRDGFVVLPAYLAPDTMKQLVATTDHALAMGLAAGADTSLFDFEPTAPDQPPVVQRIRKPHDYHPFYMTVARLPQLLDLIEQMIGPDIRLHHSKINIKAPNVGSPLEWHQDWAFIPHTNRSLAIMSIFLDDCNTVNGPMLMLPGSHRGDLQDHHHGGVFFGAIDAARLPLETAVEAVGPAGTVTLHHPLMIHGSGYNRGSRARRILFFEYAATDAWPLFYGVDYADFDRRRVRGKASNEPRLEAVYVKMPYPTAVAGTGKIYDQQRAFDKKFFVAG